MKTFLSLFMTGLAVVLLAGCAASNTPAPALTVAPTIALESPTVEAAEPEVEPSATATSPEAIPQSGADDLGVVYQIIPGESEARYRIREQLVNLDLPNDAIGKTSQVSGSIALNPDGTIDSAGSSFAVDVSTLQSDRSQRDNYVRRNVLNTSQYPNVTFVPTQVIGLPDPLPESGPVTFQITGDLTILDVTRPVTWEVSGTVDGEQASGLAVTSFSFEEFNLRKPQVPIVLSVEDTIYLELDLVLQRVGENTQAGALPASPPAGSQPSPVPVQCSSPANLTPPMMEGPYYTPGSPQQTNLVQQGMPGTRLILTGYVLTPDCQPIANAWIDFWQADALGQYDNTGYTLRGHQFTDANGFYRLETIIPGQYPGRTEHIHVKVQPQNGDVLTTQLYFPGAAQNESDRIFDSGLLVNVETETPELMEATFNFIVQP